LQFVFQRQIVFDDPVVHHHDVAFAVAVRMRVFLGGTPVRGPARMADAERAIDGVQPNSIFQIAQLTLGAPDLELVIAAIYCQACRVVSTILEPFQSLQDNGNGFSRTNITDNPTHAFIIVVSPVSRRDTLR
jgi:hypothetical protein